MELHQLQSNRGLKNKKRVGRGGKKGTYSGRGVKGQKSRSGARFEPIIRPLIKRYHKLKGVSYTSGGKNKILATVNLTLLDKNFEANEVVSPETLKEKGVISSRHKKIPAVKILGDGEINKSLKIERCSLSESARDKIMAAKGEIIDEKIKRGKKTKKELTPEQMQEKKATAQKQAMKRREAKKKTSGKRKKEAAKKAVKVVKNENTVVSKNN